MSNSLLPAGWELQAIRDSLAVKYGKALKKEDRSGGSVPVYGSGGVVGFHNASITGAPCVVIGRKGSIGTVYYSSGPCWPIDTAYFIDDFGGLNPRYVEYALKRLNLGTMDTSSAIPGLNREELYRRTLPIAPLPEQKRIVAKLDEIMAEIKAAKEHLTKAKELIRKFRQSVLNAAVTGKLTEGWRTQQQRVLEAGKMRRLDALTLPRKWSLNPLSAICSAIGDVDHRMPKAQIDGVPYVSPKDFTSVGTINLDGAKKITQVDYERLCRKIRPEKGDILLSRYGTIGEVRIIETDLELQASYSIAIIKPVDRYTGRYLAIALQSDLLQDQMVSYTRASAQPDLGLKHIRVLSVPIPPQEEQSEIVIRVSSLLRAAEFLSVSIKSLEDRMLMLSKSSLSQAFRGELVEIKEEAQ